MKRTLLTACFITLSTFLLSGCVTTARESAHQQAADLCGLITYKPLAFYYLECEAKHTGFVEIMSCAQAERTSGCKIEKSCSTQGSEVLSYTNDLAEKVLNNEITEVDAFKQWNAYKKKTDYPVSLQEAQAEIDRINAEARPCYERSYPQFYSTETRKRSELIEDLKINQSPAVQTTCTTSVTGNVQCTSW